MTLKFNRVLPVVEMHHAHATFHQAKCSSVHRHWRRC